MRSCAVLPALCLAIGCGSGGSSPDGAPAAIASITPADGATKVTPLTAVTIQLSGAADPASVTTQSVRLWLGDTKRQVFADVNYDDAAHAITLRPAYPLAAGQSFRVAIDGVTGGGASITASSQFHTVYNPAISYLTYDGTGAATSRADYEYDASGRSTARVIRTAGTDGTFGTADDGIASWTSTTFPSANLTRIVGYGAAGTDGVWRTDDDVTSSYSESTTGTAGTTHNVTYTGPGTDGVWLTADDKAQTFGDFTYDDGDRDVRDVYSLAGPDGTVGTADDTTSDWYADVYGTSFDYDRIAYVEAGTDGVWLDADDTTMAFDHVAFDDRGGIARDASFVTGSDGKPNTTDDAEVALTTYEHDNRGLPTRVIFYSAAGADNTWGTADDTVAVYYEYTHDDQGNLTEYASFSLGADGVPFNGDDYKSYVEKHDATL